MVGTRNKQMHQASICAEVLYERDRQDEKFGVQNHRDGTGTVGDQAWADIARQKNKANDKDGDNWRDILMEEVYEAFAETDQKKLRAELVQVAAVAVAWVECIDRRRNVQ